MFAIAFLILFCLFFFAVWGVGALLPIGKWRPLFPLGVLACVFAYPFLHLARPSYAEFKELCSHPTQASIIKKKSVDFILLDWGFSSDCKKGPAYIANHGYLGFDCNKRVGLNSNSEAKTQFYRYTRKPGAPATCGLECFDEEDISKPEANFGLSTRSNRARAGYMASSERRVTVDRPFSSDQEIPFWQWLRFNDQILVDATDGDMAFTSHYTYLPYGPITILGFASGSAPTEQCPWPPTIDPRDVYKPKRAPSPLPKR
ncbi:hypothetical protein [Ralstonia sp. SET104]|uniref:hypothetical protein n=1 Tax=Ralstonia sp. SET104 TaxID=2448774 RepID=UPI000F561140|nr:hypothetical protein [Ralstonia sp. SET104]GCB06797.1 hypothetical protein PSUB009319_44280 [Ralstonia sp. SET104]